MTRSRSIGDARSKPSSSVTRYFFDKVRHTPLPCEYRWWSAPWTSRRHTRARGPDATADAVADGTRTSRAIRLRSDVKGIGIDADDGRNVCASDDGGVVHNDVDTRVDTRAVRRGPNARAEGTVVRARRRAFKDARVRAQRER